MKNIIIVADFFKENISGGAELHDDVVIEFFKKTGRFYDKKRCQELTEEYIVNNKDKKWFICNFASMNQENKALLSKYCSYFIYEHDYKFDINRNPSLYENFVVPKQNIVNINFYKSAKKVICLSKMHRQIFEKNLALKNYENFNCSMWSDEQLSIIKNCLLESEKNKNGKYAVIDSNNPTKKTEKSIQYCVSKNIDFDLIKSSSYETFMKILSKYSGLVAFTGHPEPTPRIAIEAKMLNLKFVCQKIMNCVVHEDYYYLTGENMITKVRSMRDENLQKLLRWFDEV